MGADFGFVTTRPDTVHGDRTSTIGSVYIWAQKFTLSASGTFNLTEIGAWGGYGAVGTTIVLGVFTHDASHDCPESLVTNSTSDAITVTSNVGMGDLQYHTYGTQPQVTSNGSTVFWIVCTQNADFMLANTATGGAAVYRSGTYPNWPTSGDWETHTDSTVLGDFYAVYEAAATSQFARPSSDVAGGTFRSILVTAPFGPRVIA
jgi:hypothetical protein